MKRNTLNLCLVMMISLLMVGSLLAQNDPKGKVDQCTVVLKETAKPNHWEVEINYTNDEPLFGMVFPLLIRSDKGNLMYDSTSFADSRVEDFAVKIPFEDTTYTKLGKGLKINLGLIGSVGPNSLEMKPGKGLIARHYISGEKGVTTGSIMVDSTFINPANHIMGTMIDAKTSIKPAFKFERAGKD